MLLVASRQSPAMGTYVGSASMACGRTRQLKHPDARSQPLQLAENGAATRLVLGGDAVHVLQELFVEPDQRLAQRFDERLLLRGGLGNSDVHFFELL